MLNRTPEISVGYNEGEGVLGFTGVVNLSIEIRHGSLCSCGSQAWREYGGFQKWPANYDGGR